MFDIICVTNRRLCREPFLVRMERLAAARPAAVILREKDLPEAEYRALAAQVLALCRKTGVPCILHSFAAVARELDCPALHLPLPLLRALPPEDRARFSVLGASCHSETEAVEAAALGATCITAGHVFDTDCKRGVPGRGPEFLRRVCESVSIPVYAIGGIGKENLSAVAACGAAGACVMSGAMTCADPAAYLAELRGART